MAAALISAEARQRGDQSRRRIFIAARFDAPLDLQGSSFDTLVYDVRDPEIVRRLLPHAEPGTTSADYVVASIAELETTPGSPMVAYCRTRGILVALGDAGPYRVWRIPPPTGPAVAR
jgi:hypothetical protein